MAKRNYITDDTAAKWERAAKKIQRRPQPRQLPSIPPPAPPPTVTSLFRVYNNGSETIPEFGVMQVEELSEQYGQFSGETKDAYSVIQPDGEGSLFLINAGGEILEGHFGSGMFADEPTKSLFDPDSTGPSFMATIGPTSGEWHMSEDGTGFAYIGLPDEEEETVIVREKRSTSEQIAGGLRGSAIASPFNSSGTTSKLTFLNSQSGFMLTNIDNTTNSTLLQVDTGNQTIKVKQAGLYQVAFHSSVDPETGAATAIVSCNLVLNSSTGDVAAYETTVTASTAASIGYIGMGFSMPIVLDADDELYITGDTQGETIRFHESAFTVTKIG